MAKLHCPTCQREFDAQQSPALPFCSERCRLVDLGRWFREEHRVPYERSPVVDDEPGPE